jgi:hypothetical protein
MTLDTTSLITLTDSALEAGNALCVLAGKIAARRETGAGMGTTIVVVGSSPSEQQAMERRSNALCATGDLFCRSNLVTLPARENAQRLVGLLNLVGEEAMLLDPALHAPITRGHALEAEPRLLHAKRYEQAAGRTRVLVIAGGVGRTPEGETTSLGTGGAELSGLFIAQRLGLPVRLVVSPREIRKGYALPRRADLFARKHGVSFSVRSDLASSPAPSEPVPA